MTRSRLFKTIFYSLIFYYLIIPVILLGGLKPLNNEPDFLFLKQGPARPVMYNVKEEYIATVTAYTASHDETDSTPNITADGSYVKVGMIACPSRYKFGTLIEIRGFVYECHDRMAVRYRNAKRFDVFTLTKHQAYQWGKQNLKIRVLELSPR